jgi:hypothetical protein
LIYLGVSCFLAPCGALSGGASRNRTRVPNLKRCARAVIEGAVYGIRPTEDDPPGLHIARLSPILGLNFYPCV